MIDTAPPIADAGPDGTVKEGEDVVFDASGSRDNYGIVGCNWDLGDGRSSGFREWTAEGCVAGGTSPEAGTYTVTLTVFDGSGNTATDTATVTVEAVAAFPWGIGGAVAVGVAGTAMATYGYTVTKRTPKPNRS